MSRAASAGCRKIADLRWRGGIVAGDDDRRRDRRRRSRRALNRAIEWLRANDERSRDEVLRDLTPEQRKTGMMPELLGVQGYKPAEFQDKVDWMMERGFLERAPAYEDIVRPSRSDRRAERTDELSEDEIAAVERSEMAPGLERLNDELRKHAAD